MRLLSLLAAWPALFALCATPASSQQVSAGRTPAAIFADKLAFSDLALSPDGTRVAAIDHGGNHPRLVVLTLAAEDRKPEYFDNFGSGISAVAWAGPNRLLVTTGIAFQLWGMTVPFSRLVAVDLQTRKTQPVDPDNKSFSAGEVLYTDPAGGWILLAVQKTMGGTPWVKRIDLVTGAVSIVEKSRPDVWNWFADSTGLVRAGIAYDNDRWTMWYRDRPGASLAKVRSPSFKGMLGTVDSVYFFPGEQRGAIVANAKSDRFAAYRFDFRTGEIGEEIYGHPQVDVTAIIANPATRTIAGVSYEDERSRVAWIEPGMAAAQKRLDKAFPGAETRVIDRSDDGNRVLIWLGGASDPGTYYLFDLAARRLEALVQPHQKLSKANLTPVTPIRYTARDGLEIPGYLTLPVGKPDKGLPLVVMPHGGPFVRDSWRYDPYVQFLASRGYAVLQPNFRGSTGYGRNFVEQGYGQWGRKMQDDVDDGVDWLVGKGTVDAKRVCIMGASYGGYVALWGAIRNPEKYRCAVGLASVTDLPGMLKYDRRSFNAPRYFRQWESRVRGEKETDLKALSPLAQAGRMTVPVLIAHGSRDDNVPAEQAQKMIKALAARKKPQSEVVSVFYADEGHGLQKSENIADFLTRLEVFLTKHNPAE